MESDAAGEVVTSRERIKLAFDKVLKGRSFSCAILQVLYFCRPERTSVREACALSVVFPQAFSRAVSGVGLSSGLGFCVTGLI